MAAAIDMGRLENLGPTGEPLGDVPDAEFVEVSGDAGTKAPGPTPPVADMTLRDLWQSIGPLPKILIASSPIWLLALCSTISSEPPKSEMTPEQLVAATDMSAVAGGESASGQVLALDDLAGGASEDCAGKFIWTFNSGGTPGTVSLQDEAGTSVTSGKYQLSEQNLRLTDLVERRPGNDAGANGHPTKDVTYHIGRTPEGRVIIGKKDYRQCTLKAEPPSPTPLPVAAPPASPPPQENVPQPIAAALPPSLTPDEACDRLSGELHAIIEGNSNGQLNVIEASATKGLSSVKDDGTLSCYGTVITDRGTLAGFYGTTYSPKGQLLITWNPDQAAIKLLNSF